MEFIKKLSFLLCFLLPALAVLGEYLGGYCHFIVPLTVFGALPLLDIFIGKDSTNPKEAEFQALQSESYYRYLTYFWAYLQMGFVIWALYRIAMVPHSALEFVLFALSVGLVTGGIGITVAHELGHKNTKYEQFLSKMVLMTVCYMHFFIEHNRGHHVHVSTPIDPASSRKNESFYSFYPRTVIGSFVSAWNIEAKRLSKQGLGAFTLKNEWIQYLLLTFGFIGFLFASGSYLKGSLAFEVVGFFLIQSVIAFSLLELVNYIEHYGLKRKETAPGKYEKVLPVHSWNQNYLISNAFLFQLQRHSDHHTNAGRRYQALRHFEEAPQLPYGYEVMILLALFPPVWYRVVNPILESWEAKK